MALRSRKKIKNTSALRRLTEKHLSPSPRIREGRFIAANRFATAMIDISDGLIADLRHILKNSSQGAEIWVDAIPFSPEVIRYSPLYRMNPADLALAGGEDYELLFTVPRKKLNQLLHLSKEFSFSLTMIGKITGERGKIRLRKTGGEPLRIQKEGFRHF
jgi:thiamine-monophosphate kinase